MKYFKMTHDNLCKISSNFKLHNGRFKTYNGVYEKQLRVGEYNSFDPDSTSMNHSFKCIEDNINDMNEYNEFMKYIITIIDEEDLQYEEI